MNRQHTMPFGCQREGDSYCFQLWAPAAQTVTLEWLDAQEHLHAVPLIRDASGWYRLRSTQVKAGDRYGYRINDQLRVPDPASRFQPDDVHGLSEIIDPLAVNWRDHDWRGRPWQEAVIYELHVGTFSPRGDYAGVIARLDYLVALGVTALELMPLADTPGQRNWGYDGALWFAPESRYGRPEELKRLVQEAHARGLMVLLDVVYNHFGPEGNYLHLYAPELFHPTQHTPWGAALDGAHPLMRKLIIHNALYWLEEYGFDGLRLDAVDQIIDPSTPDLLTELADRVQHGPGKTRQIHLILEHDGNEAARYGRDAHGQPEHYTAQWNDDAHHALHVLLTGETQGYYQDYAQNPLAHLGRALAEGCAYQGEPSAFRGGKPRGTPSAHLPSTAWVNFLQNHDQVGNRAQGERLDQLISQDAFETVLALLLLAPSPPLLFMGQEFAAPNPFLFFCDLEPALAEQVRSGRQREFAHTEVPDPCAEPSFLASRLDWAALETTTGQTWWTVHRDLLALRQREIVPLLSQITQGGQSQCFGDRGLHLEWPLAEGGQLVLRVNLGEQALTEPVPTTRAHLRLIYSRHHAGWGRAAPWSVRCWVA